MGYCVPNDISTVSANLVEVHNYTPASSVQAKIYNFDTLNQKVLKRFGYQLTRSQIEDVVNCRPGAIESVLNTLQIKMSKFKGTTYVFDERMGARITSDVLSDCETCGYESDTFTNCALPSCHVRFIQCGACKTKYSGCCSLVSVY
jgi:hypothetical protein